MIDGKAFKLTDRRRIGGGCTYLCINGKEKGKKAVQLEFLAPVIT